MAPFSNTCARRCEQPVASLQVVGCAETDRQSRQRQIVRLNRAIYRDQRQPKGCRPTSRSPSSPTAATTSATYPVTSTRRPSTTLDWFHLTMRITVLTQLAKGLRVPPQLSATLAAELQRLKWFLWHGNVFRSLQTVDDIATDLEDQDTGGQQDRDRLDKLAKAVREFGGYLAANASAIPNYGERYRAGEIISTSFVESAVNQVISKRMVKK